jgi:hypothetical protein
MPFHFDGVFKTKTNEDGSVTADPPQFQVFQCRQAPSADDPAADAGGRTLFTSTALIYNQVIANNVSPFAEDIKSRKWTVFTPMNKSPGGQPLELPLVETNPLSGRKVIRWHEQWRVYSGVALRGVQVSKLIFCFQLGRSTSPSTSQRPAISSAQMMSFLLQLATTLQSSYMTGASISSKPG